MARVVGKTPYAEIVEQDDGTVRAFPPGLFGEPPPPPVPAAADPAIAPPLAAPSFAPPVPPPVPAPPVAPAEAVAPAVGPGPTPAPAAAPVVEPAAAPAPPIAAPPVEVDAVSGADSSSVAPVPPTEPYTPEGAADAPLVAPPVDPEQEAIDRAAAAGALAANQADERAAQMQEASARIAEIEALRAEAAARVADHRATVQAEADRAVDDYVSFDLKPEDKISGANLMALIFGGIGNVLMGQGGAANPVLGILERKADQRARDRADRYKQLADRVGARGAQSDTLAAMAKDQDTYYQLAKAGELENLARQIEATAAGYDSERERMKAADVVAQIRAQGDAARAAAADAEHKRQIEAAKLQLDQQRAETDRYQALTARKAVGAQYARIGEDRRQFNLSRQDTIEQRDRAHALDLAKLDLEIQKASAEGRQKDVSALREEREAKAQDAARQIGVFPVTLKDDQGKVIGAGWEELKNKDGTAFRAPDSKRAQELSTKGAAVNESVALLDRLTRAREKYGWSSDLFKSDEWREMAADFGRLILVAKDEAGLGALAGPDVEVLTKAFGTTDPSELRDPGAGLTRARLNMVQSFNASLRANGYTGDPFDIPDVSSKGGLQKAAENSEAERIAKDITKTARNDVGATLAKPLFNSQAREAGVNVHELSPKMAARVEPLLTLAQSGDPSAQASLVQLMSQNKYVGPALKVLVVRRGIDLGPYGTKEVLEDARKEESRALRPILPHIPSTPSTAPSAPVPTGAPVAVR